uniref:Uncharacterized protein n=1 Tax=Solanum lycopersicum TaxID=4081 RepID=K4CZD2_SOLLC
MTPCTTLGAVVLTPLLKMILAGTYVPVDAVKLSISTLQMSATLVGLAEPQKRVISIEVGMQNSSLGVVLATAHFTSPLVASNVSGHYEHNGQYFRFLLEIYSNITSLKS